MNNKNDMQSAVNKLMQAKCIFIRKEKWLNEVIHTFNYYVVESKVITTACTDGKNIFFNKDFLLSLREDELVFVLGHEVLHCLLNHMDRIGNRDRRMFNIACDYNVNSILVSFKVGRLLEGALYEPKYQGLTSEEIYKQLSQLLKNDLNSMDNHIYDDQHNASSDDNEEDQKLKEEIQRLAKELNIDTKEKDAKEIENLIEKLYHQHKNELYSNKNSMIKSVLENYNFKEESLISWQEVLKEYLYNLVQTEITYMKPNRKGYSGDFILPSYRREPQLNIAVAIDVSGSMKLSWIHQFMEEIYSILKDVPQVKIDLWGFADTIRSHMKLDVNDIEELRNFRCLIDGLTIFNVNWEFMQNNNINPDIFIMLTDGEPTNNDWAPRENLSECIFTIINNNQITAPYGKTIHIEI